MKSNFLCASVLFLAFFISTGFIFSTPSSIDFEKNSPSQTNFVLQDTSKKVDSIEVIPAQFEGGMDEFYRYVAEKLKYPFMARLKGKEGKVFVQFVIDKDGSVIDVIAVKSPSKHLSKEAVRVVKSSPKWIPATHEGKIVKVRMTMPINFTLED